MRQGEKKHSLRFLMIRALVVVAVVVTALLVLRFQGIIIRERDVPAPVVEEIAREGEVSGFPAGEQPQTAP